MSNNEKNLSVKDAMYRTAKDLDSGLLWTSQAIANIAELAGINVRGTHSEVLIALSSKLAEENRRTLQQGIEVGVNRNARVTIALLAELKGWPMIEKDECFDEWIDRCFILKPKSNSALSQDDASPLEALDCCARASADSLDIDNETFNALDTVWHIETLQEGTVDDIRENAVHVHWVDMTIGDCWVDPALLTHDKPPTGADGVPLKVFERVWDVETGIAYIVAELPHVPGTCKKVRAYRCGDKRSCSWYLDTSELTHSRPNVEKIE